MMKIGRWEGNEIIYTVDVVDNSVNLIEDFDFTTDSFGATMIISGMVVTEALTPDMTILISAGIAKDFTTEHFLIGEDLVGTVTTSDAILDRKDIVEVRRLIEDTTPATRQFKDPITEDITEVTIDTKSEYKTEIKVLAGTPGTGLSPAVEAGWIKIAEILIPAASLTVIDTNIYNVDAEKEGDNNTNWTTTMASIYRNGTISEMKTAIVPNTVHRASDGKDHSDVVLNNTHRTSDGSDHTFIDQDVKTTSGPSFVEITIDGITYESVRTSVAIDGSGLTISGIGTPALAAMDSTHVAFIDRTLASLRMYVWNGSVWALDGTPFSIPGIQNPSLTALDSTHVVFIDDLLDSLRTYVWSGSAWTLDGSALSVSGIGNCSITTLDSTHIVLIDDTTKLLQTYVWSGSAWSLDGTGLSITGIFWPRLTTLDSTHVVLIDSTIEKLETYIWNGSTWALVGSGLTISGILFADITALDSTHIVFFDSTILDLRVYSWNGSAWTLDSPNLGISGAGTSVLTTLNNTRIVFIDDVLESLRTYKYTYELVNT